MAVNISTLAVILGATALDIDNASGHRIGEPERKTKVIASLPDSTKSVGVYTDGKATTLLFSLLDGQSCEFFGERWFNPQGGGATLIVKLD